MVVNDNHNNVICKQRRLRGFCRVFLWKKLCILWYKKGFQCNCNVCERFVCCLNELK